MKVLVTGGCGFLGSHLCRWMVADGHDVRVLVRPESRMERLKNLRVTTVLGDVIHRESLAPAVRDREWVIHAAADLNYWRQYPDRQMNVNVEGTRNIAQACRLAGVARLLHVSSVAAIGIPTSPESPANEDFSYNLTDPGLIYHHSKHRAEDVIASEVDLGLDAVIVNPASITSADRLSALMQSVRRSPIVPCFSGGNCVAHVSDVVDGIVAAIERGRTGHRYILGGENLRFRAMAEKAAMIMNLSRRFVPIPPLVTGLGAALLEPLARWRNRPPKFAYMIHYCANRFLYYNSGKARAELNYHPRDFDAILRGEAVR